MALTGKQRRFVEARARGLTNTQAAIEAGYSKETAPQAGSRLAKHPEVVAGLAKLAESQKGKAKAAPKAAAQAPAVPPGSDIIALAKLYSDPRDFLKAVMNDTLSDIKLRTDAAKALMPYEHQKLGEGGKKDQKQEAARKVAGRFGAAAPPRLAASGGKKV